ncbi:rho GTPase-activating protein 30 isoform X2 [Hyperolius riggenbachi]
MQDVHCVSSLCKAYFRELPNPLLTYQLYDKFADAVAIQLEEQRLIKIRDVLKELPLPHYRTLEYLMKHLIHMASFSAQTNMHARNLAIVWAPNLLRSKDIESTGFNGTAAFMEVRIQSIVVEFILTHVDQLFGAGSSDGNVNSPSAVTNWPSCVPEDYYRSLSYNLPSMLNHGDGPPQMRPYHTIIEISEHKRKGSLKAKKWKSIFNLGRSNNDSKRKSVKQDEKDEKSGSLHLRPAKSMDSLSSVSDVSDLEQRGLTRRSAKHQLAIRRESLGTESKHPDSGYNIVDPAAQALEVNDGDDEEEGQAKSEPTTPKPGRASVLTNPQGRSPKNNRNRAEKCVGVHISGPFSVTLPFHITSNLSRLTRGMECPSLSYSVLHRSSERLFSPEGQLYMGSPDTDKVRLTMVSQKENNDRTETTIKDDCDQKAEANRMLLEMQDTFSFLDNQDSNPEESKSTDAGEAMDKTLEYSVDSEILTYDLEHNIPMEEFSVEPPPDDLCIEDESDQVYFTPSGCLDIDDPWRASHDSLEDVYLSAYDDLSPLSEELNKQHEPKEEIIEKGEHGGTKESSEGGIFNFPLNLEQPGEPLCETQKSSEISISQQDMVDGSHSNLTDTENNSNPQCYISNKPELESTYSVDKTEEHDVTQIDDKEIVENLDSQPLADGDSCNGHTKLKVKDDVTFLTSEVLPNNGVCKKAESSKDKVHIQILVNTDVQGGEKNEDRDTLGSEATMMHMCYPNIQDSDHYENDDPLEHKFNINHLGSGENQNVEFYKDILLAGKSIVTNLDFPDVQDPQLPKEDELTVEQSHLKCLDFLVPGHYDKDDIILLQDNAEIHPTTLEEILECIQDLNNSHLHCESHLQANCTTKMLDCSSDNYSLLGGFAEPLPLKVYGNATEDQLLENEDSHLEDHKCIMGNLQLPQTEMPLSDLYLCIENEVPMEMNRLSDELPMILLPDHQIPQHDGSNESKLQIQNVSSMEQSLSEIETPTTSENMETSRVNSDGSVAIKMTSITNKIHHARSVPVVPPKPQFAKLPPALKNKLHASSLPSTGKDIKFHKSAKDVRSEATESETSSDYAPKRRSSWRTAGSVSFDTAMTLAKERQQPQNPVRRMQTYCIGDSIQVTDSKLENPPNLPKFTIKPASSRASRPLSCMSLSATDAELRSHLTTQSAHGDQSVFRQESEAYTKELPQRNRLSMPRIGKPSAEDDQMHTCHHQRLSLL